MNQEKHLFILPGDKFKSNIENRYFHKDETYEISSCFNSKNGMLIFIYDKNGKEIPFKPYNFDSTTRTDKDMGLRRKQSRLNFMWDNPDVQMVFDKFNGKERKKIYFDFGNTAYYGSGPEGQKGHIEQEHRETDPNDGRTRHLRIPDTHKILMNKEDFNDYFKDYSPDDLDFYLHFDGLYSNAGRAVDHMQFMQDQFFEYFSFDKLDTYSDNFKLNLQDIKHSWYGDGNKNDFIKTIKLLSNVIFDTEEINDFQKLMILDIINAFEIAPKSYGPTAIVKLFRGKAKAKNKNLDHLFGKYEKTLKAPQMFILIDIIESFLYTNKVFVTKEEYSSGDEWRGTFEFIGSKGINTEKLNEYKNILL